MFPTNKLYVSVSLNEHESFKIEALNKLVENYENLSVDEKWELVINAFIQLIPSDNSLHNKLREFASKRTNKAFQNQYNVPLEDCLIYFENFYFIYSTEEEKFKLTQSQKNEFLITLKDAIDVCETGLKTRFESILKQYQTDCNWIRNHLYKWRYNILSAMHDKYNEQHHIEDGYRVHVLLKMSELAKNYQLGIEYTGRDLQDVHASQININEIVRYFQKNVVSEFLEYERNILNNLTQHIVYEIKRRFSPKVDSTIEQTTSFNWETQNLIIPIDNFENFSAFIDEHVTCPDAFSLMSFFTLDDDSSTILPTLNEFSKLVKIVLKHKMILEGYFISVKQLTENQEDLRENLRLMLDIPLEKIIKVSEIIQSQETFNWGELEEYKDVIFNYPYLILENIEKFPEILHSLPPEIKFNTRFLEIVLENLELIFCIEKNETNEQYADIIMEILELSDGNLFVAQAVLDKDLSKKLVARNGLLLKNLPYDLQNDEEIVTIAVSQNSFALIYASKEQQKNRSFPPILPEFANESIYFQIALAFEYFKNALPGSVSLEFNELPDFWEHNPDEISHIYLTINRMRVAYNLIQVQNINILDLFESLEILSPDLLKAVLIARRQNRDMPPIPFISNTRFLRHFNNELVRQGFNNWDDGFWNIRKRASESILTTDTSNNHPNHNIMHYLAKNSSWILSMMQFEIDNLALTGFQNSSDALLQFTQANKASLKFLMSISNSFFMLNKDILKTIMWFSMYYFIYETVRKDNWASVFIPVGLIIMQSLYLQHSFRETLESLLTCYAMPFITLRETCTNFYNNMSIHTIPEFERAATLNYLFIFKVLNTIFQSDPFGLTKRSDLLTRCYAGILQLRLTQVDIADEGANLLQTLLDNALSHAAIDLNSLSANQALEMQLEKALKQKQNITIRGKEITLSFDDALKLSKKNPEFIKVLCNPDSEQREMGFFRRNLFTTAEPLQLSARLG